MRLEAGRGFGRSFFLGKKWKSELRMAVEVESRQEWNSECSAA